MMGATDVDVTNVAKACAERGGALTSARSRTGACVKGMQVLVMRSQRMMRAVQSSVSVCGLREVSYLSLNVRLTVYISRE